MPPLPQKNGASDSDASEFDLEPAELPPPPPPKPAPKGLEVVALQAGFYKNVRRVEGDVFSLSKFSDRGTWMRFSDPQAEKKHQELIAVKKEERKKKIAKAEKEEAGN